MWFTFKLRTSVLSLLHHSTTEMPTYRRRKKSEIFKFDPFWLELTAFMPIWWEKSDYLSVVKNVTSSVTYKYFSIKPTEQRMEGWNDSKICQNSL